MHPTPSSTAVRDALLDEAVAAYLQAEAEGDTLDRPEWLARYREVSAELEDFFTDRDGVRRLMAPLQAVAGAVQCDTARSNEVTQVQPDLTPGAAPLSAPPWFCADYELLACLGRGGMGVVYRARQHSLNRLVALKMIRTDELFSPAEVARFRNEAELVAQLDHPGIVPVYDVGASDGQPFFTMKLIEGGNLLAHLDRFLADPRAAAAALVQVAQAVHHAHQRGILHRDLKPSNILVDADGRPLVTDFGLAKRVAGPDGRCAENALTRSDIIVGTPSYLAPEQTLGKRAEVTTAADVYGLGAILYALLTSRPPFAGPSVLDTLEWVRSREPVPPRRLRPAAPRDLETICLKCLAKEPARRYASAAHLAEDLGRFLEGKPVQARPAGPVRQLVKWARRRPALAGLIGVTLAAVLVVVGLTVHHQGQLQSALEETQARAEEARRSKEQALANYRHAREAIKQMLDRAGDPKRGGVPQILDMRRELRQDALAFLLKAAEQQGDEPEILADVAEACVLAAQLQDALGQPEAARANVERARDLLAGLAERFPQDSSYALRLAYAWMALGIRHQKDDPGVVSIRRALAIYEGLEARGVDVGSGTAMAHHNLASVFHHQGKKAEAEAHWRKSLALDEKSHRAHPQVPKHRRALAQTQLNLSVLLQQQPGRLAEATAFHDQAEAHLAHLVGANPNDLDSIYELALLRVNWSYTLLDTGKAAQAVADLNKNEQLLRDILVREPNLVWLRDLLFRTHGTRAIIHEKQGRFGEAAADFEQVVALSPPPERDGHRVTLAMLRAKSGDHARAVADAETLARELPASTSWKGYYRLARTCSDALAALEKDSVITAADRAPRADRYTALALRLLDKARAAAGAAEWQQQAATLGLELWPLSGRAAFRQWLKANPPGNHP